jgi:hypothetical protein
MLLLMHSFLEEVRKNLSIHAMQYYVLLHVLQLRRHDTHFRFESK